MTRFLLLWLVASITMGCAHRVYISSDPVGAEVRVRKKDSGVTPMEIIVWGVPFTHPTARVSHAGYRTEVIDLSADIRPFKRVAEFLTFRWKRAFAIEPASAHDILLVKRHGMVGTWSSEDVD